MRRVSQILRHFFLWCSIFLALSLFMAVFFLYGSGVETSNQPHNVTSYVDFSDPTVDYGDTFERFLGCVESNVSLNFKKNGWEWTHYVPNNPKFVYKAMCQPQWHDHPDCFPARADWVLTLRRSVSFHRDFNSNKLPSTVWCHPRRARQCFQMMKNCFPEHHRFVILIGDEDLTCPQQVDSRFFTPVFTPEEWNEFINDKRLSHLFVGHLDVPPSEKVSPLPIGLNPREFVEGGNPDKIYEIIQKTDTHNILQRPLKVLFSNRIREGKQWGERGIVYNLCKNVWEECDPSELIHESKFWARIQKYPFTLCVRGGGIEPNPMVYTALFLGSIPIVKHFVSESVYKGLPIVYVDDWGPETLRQIDLEKKRTEFAPFFSDATLRKKVMEILTSDYWWKEVLSKLL